MTFQYALRFDSGERRGEVVPIAIADSQGAAFTIGRKPGNSLQVTDASVSGRHAELVVDGGVLSIRDLNSTNGTEVAGRRVRQAELGHGDRVALGKVEFAVLDRTRDDHGAPGPALELEGDEVPDPSVPGETRVQARDEGFQITADDLARSRRTSKLGPLALVALAAAAAGAWSWSSRRAAEGGDEGPGRAVAAVESPPGNLIGEGHSFESTGGWLFEDGDGVPFGRSSAAAASGRRGARVELAGGASGVLAHAPVSCDGPLRISARVRAADRTDTRVGVRFSGDDALPPVTVWSEPAPAGDRFVELALTATPPPGYDRAQVQLRASCDAPAPAADDEDPPLHGVDVDDVAAVPAGAGAPLHIHASWRVHPLARSGDADDHRALSVASLERTLLPLLIARPAGGGPGSVGLSVSSDGGDVVLRPAGNGALELLVHRDLAEAGVASISGPAGAATYAGHGPGFEAAGATSVLLGADAGLVRLALPEARTVAGRPAGDHVSIQLPVSAGEDLRLQLDFSEGRTRGQRLARRAEEERAAGRSGDALRTWGELMAEVPFDTALIERAAAAQSRIVEGGRQELAALGDEVERARFFGLEPLYREKLARAEELAERFRGSEVETAAASLADAIRAELDALGGDGARLEEVRLEGIAGALRAAGAAGLASRVDQYRGREDRDEDR